MNASKLISRRGVRIFGLGLLRLVLVWGVLSLTAAHAGRVSARTDTLTIPTYGWAAVPHPYFRGTDRVNIYPYPMLDFLSREKTNRVYQTVVLENDFLRITFLPELGGKIHEVMDKTTGTPMFYVNHVIKPGLIGQCGAWTSGGVEWNTGPQGHTVSCMLPVDMRILPRAEDGSVSVAVGETERIYGTKWTVVVTLRPDRSFIEERIRIYNPTEAIRPYYFWNCTAAPNTPGFRFVYPMTLGCDHAGEKFFRWPIDNGKDLTRGTNYTDAASIFAWHCDQDFFGSYNDDLGRGVVAVANHHQLPGKKAWTWGRGGFGKMHQMDLTDDDGPYNEVQTGPLLTQAQVGRLDPSEAVEWQEWWYPIRGIGGFTFANKNLAVNVATNQNQLSLRVLPTGSWKPVTVRLANQRGAIHEYALGTLIPNRPREVLLPLPSSGSAQIEFRRGDEVLARFGVPLPLPDRQSPAEKPKPASAVDFVKNGWDDFLFARFTDAENSFRKALELQPDLAPAQTGLAFLNTSRSPVTAQAYAQAALETEPESGLANFVLAAGAQRTDTAVALEKAWKAALAPETAVPGRALIGKILIRQKKWAETIAALKGPGPWATDPVCQVLRAFAELRAVGKSCCGQECQDCRRFGKAHSGGGREVAVRLARRSLATDPLDTFALAVLWLAMDREGSRELSGLLEGKAVPVLQLAGVFEELDQPAVAARVVKDFYLDMIEPENCEALVRLWAAGTGNPATKSKTFGSQRAGEPLVPEHLAYPFRAGDLRILEAGVKHRPDDAGAWFYLGSVLFHLGRHNEGREAWSRAAQLGGDSAKPLRALGMASRTLDADLPGARRYLEQAQAAAPADPIIARDLARILFDLADQQGAGEEKQRLLALARDHLRAAFPAGRGRSDFVGLLARAQNRLGEYGETARMLDSVRVTVWEGAREVHDLFEQAHLALGEESLRAGKPVEALAHFDRALEYPENLATGKLENAREAHIQYLRGNALAALGRKADAVKAWRLAADEPESKDLRQREAREKARLAIEQNP